MVGEKKKFGKKFGLLGTTNMLESQTPESCVVYMHAQEPTLLI